MLQRLLLLLTASLFYTFQTRAQAYEPGLLVRSNGDTLRGEIENGFWVEPPALIRFRAEPNGPSQLLQPRQLRVVCFTNGRYFRYQALPIDHAAETRQRDLRRGYATDVQIDSLLAEVLLDGPATLLRVVQPGSIHYPLLLPGQAPLDLCEHQYLRENANGYWQKTDGNNFRGQLLQAFANCPEARAAVLQATFTAPSLVAVTQAYNTACTPNHRPGRSWLATAAPRRWVAFQGGVLAGARYNYLTPRNSSNEACSDCKVRPFAGLYADLFLPSRSVAIYGELSLSSFSSRSSLLANYVSLPNGNFDEVYSYYKYQSTLATARLGLRYFVQLPHEQQLLLGLGFELNRVLGSTVTTTAGPPARPTDQELAYASTALFPNLGLGWRYKRFTLDLDGQMYVRGNDNSFSGFLFGSDITTRLDLAYRLSRNPDAATRVATASK
ncbi:hypothetical protein [Hymenobacter negativus]|uniref:Outer membrane protein beta-barrel domain-containing protein n=1 Tax=Hymenobacter negativus TaxID=2795026 RepID=A0ABS3QK82_9BACT|nr:hypothetical protein [Hymenobacter negativus]MBO2011668.1 hypothetical protein [Hymenobacter negativus]